MGDIYKILQRANFLPCSAPAVNCVFRFTYEVNLDLSEELDRIHLNWFMFDGEL